MECKRAGVPGGGGHLHLHLRMLLGREGVDRIQGMSCSLSAAAHALLACLSCFPTVAHHELRCFPTFLRLVGKATFTSWQLHNLGLVARTCIGEEPPIDSHVCRRDGQACLLR